MFANCTSPSASLVAWLVLVPASSPSMTKPSAGPPSSAVTVIVKLNAPSASAGAPSPARTFATSGVWTARLVLT